MNDLSLARQESPGRATPSGERQAPEVDREASAVPVVMHYLRIAVRWRWLILGSIAIAMVLGIVLTLLMTPQYTATTRIEISREGNRIVNVAGVEPEASVIDMEFYQTQYGLLASRALAERVARELRLVDDPAFFEMYGETDKYEIASSGGAASAEVTRSRRSRLAGEILLDNVQVSPIRSSRLVDVSFTSPDAELAARVANAWASSFIESNLERRFEATAYARRFLEQRLGQLRQRLEQSERQLVSYASNERIINIPVGGAAGAAGAERSLTADSLAALNTAQAEATAERIEAQSRLRGAGAGAVQEALTNPAIASMRQRRAEAAAEYSRLLTQFEPEYPAVQALRAQIAELDQSIAREESRVRNSLDNTYRSATQRESMLEDRIEGLKQNFLDLRRRSIQYNIFQRDVDTNRQLYDGLLQRYKEIGVAGGVGTNNVSIVDAAPVPDRRSHPRPILNLIAALFIGTIAGIGLALIREQIDETLSDPSDVEHRVGLPLLGVVPATEAEDVLAELHDPKSNMIESYLSIQTSLAFSTDHGIPKSISVTSTRPAEGKSITAYALAYTIARNGGRTILIDGDMRSPSVNAELNIPNDRGLSNFLAGTAAFDELIHNVESVPFAVMTTGPQPPNAAELLRSKRFEALIAEAAARFDHIIIDSPPVMGLADAPLIASRTEGTVFVLEARGVKARIARLALSRLRQGQAHILGIVLTKFEAQRAHFGYGYDYGYGYGSKSEG